MSCDLDGVAGAVARDARLGIDLRTRTNLMCGASGSADYDRAEHSVAVRELSPDPSDLVDTQLFPERDSRNDRRAWPRDLLRKRPESDLPFRESEGRGQVV